MPIHDQGYRRYAGRRDQQWRAWWVIARTGLRARLRDRRVIGLLLLAWLPCLGRAVQMYTAATFSQAAFLAPGVEMFRDFLRQQNIFVAFVTMLVGAGLVADDRRANALQIYFARPVTRADYIVGKAVTLLVTLAAVTWLPGVILLAVQVLVTGETRFLRDHLFLLPAITLAALLQVLLSALPMLALSSLSRSARFAAITYAAAAFFSSSLYEVIRGTTGAVWWAWVSPSDTLAVISDAVFRVSREPVLPVPVAILLVAGLLVGSLLILRWRVQPAEVVT